MDAIPEIEPDGKLYLFATRLFMIKGKKEMIASFPCLKNEKNEYDKEPCTVSRLFKDMATFIPTPFLCFKRFLPLRTHLQVLG